MMIVGKITGMRGGGNPRDHPWSIPDSFVQKNLGVHVYYTVTVTSPNLHNYYSQCFSQLSVVPAA